MSKKPFILKKAFWRSLGNIITGKTSCELCGKKYNNYEAMIGKDGIPYLKICYDCLNKSD